MICCDVILEMFNFDFLQGFLQHGIQDEIVRILTVLPSILSDCRGFPKTLQTNKWSFKVYFPLYPNYSHISSYVAYAVETES